MTNNCIIRRLNQQVFQSLEMEYVVGEKITFECQWVTLCLHQTGFRNNKTTKKESNWIKVTTKMIQF